MKRGAAQKKEIPSHILLAQDQEIQGPIERFESGELGGEKVADLEMLVRGELRVRYATPSGLVGMVGVEPRVAF